MEGAERTPQGDKVLFAVIAIENAAKKLNVSTEELVNRLERQNLIEGRLFRYYDMLHTQSADYVADDLIETLANYENGR